MTADAMTSGMAHASGRGWRWEPANGTSLTRSPTRSGGPVPTTMVQDGGSLAGKESSDATSTASLGRIPRPGFALPTFIDGPSRCLQTDLTPTPVVRESLGL